MLPPLIETDALEAALSAPDTRIVDASWHLSGHPGWPDYVQQRIPGAIWFDLEEHSDPATCLPHMVPPLEDLAKGMGTLGLQRTDHIVVYDTVGLRSAPRLWWMLRLLGAEDVQVLNGGLPKWVREGRPVVSGDPPPAKPGAFRWHPQAHLLAGLREVEAALEGTTQVVDARSTARFQGLEPEPRAGLRSGHMPGAINVPFTTLLSDEGTLLPKERLRAILAANGIDLSRPIITSCGSGVTAAIVSLALADLGIESRVYDGSWAEWGCADAGTPVTVD